jgi:hypothetical protein
MFTARLVATLGKVHSDPNAYTLRAEATARYLWERVRMHMQEHSMLHTAMSQAQMRHARVQRQLLKVDATQLKRN